MHQFSVIDTRDYNLRCFKVEKRGENFVVSNAETFLESCEEKVWKKNLPLALTRLAESPLEKEVVFIFSFIPYLNLFYYFSYVMGFFITNNQKNNYP